MKVIRNVNSPAMPMQTIAGGMFCAELASLVEDDAMMGGNTCLLITPAAVS